MKSPFTNATARTLAVSAVILQCVGCSVEKGIDKIGPELDSLARQVVSSAATVARDTLTSEFTRQRLAHIVDSIVTQAGLSAGKSARPLIDSLLGDALEARIDRIGTLSSEKAYALRNELFGPEARSEASAMRSSLLGDSTRALVANLRDELLGEGTRAAVQALVDSALATLAVSYRERMQPLVREDLNFLQKNVITILVVLGAIVAIVVWFIFRQKTRYRTIVELITKQIYDRRSSPAVAQLKSAVHDRAIEHRVEKPLRQLLDSQGILGKDGWNEQSVRA